MEFASTIINNTYCLLQASVQLTIVGIITVKLLVGLVNYSYNCSEVAVSEVDNHLMTV